jgi:hypothetical protein
MDKRVTDMTGDELVARLHSRKDFLKLLSAAGIGTAAGVSVLPGSAEGAVSTSLQPTDFSFTIREQFRPFHLLANNFVQLDDSFNSNTNTPGDYTVLRPGETSEEDDGEFGVSNGQMRFTGQDDYYTILKSNTGQEAPFATVIVDVASLTEGTVYAGLYRNEGNYVHAYYNETTNTVGLEARVNGVLVPLGEERPVQEEFGTSFRFAFVANENRVIALVGDSHMDIGNFRPLIERDVFFETSNDEAPGTLDLRDETVLETYKNGFGARSETGSNILFDRVQAGYFGEAGVRDPHVVQYADGAPYIKDNKLYFTLTNAGLGFFEKAHWGVWTMDLSDYTKIEQVGNIFWRNADDPIAPDKVLGHHAGQIIRDEENNRWIAVASSWGDFGPQGGDQGNFGTVTYPDEAPRFEPPVDIVYDELSLSVNLLRGVHILLERKHPVNAVPFPTEGKWDPGLTRIDGRWYLSYVIALDLFSDFQPALARSPVGADHTEAVIFVGADWSKEATEGPIIQKLGGEWRMFASSGDDEGNRDQTNERWINRYPIYFLEAANPNAAAGNREAAEAERGRMLRFDGYLEAPHPTNIPHPMIVPISITSGGRKMTKYIMLTFNGDQFFERILGYGTHGDFFVMQAEQTVRGWEFPRR